jgi:hypothetical protein
MNNPDCFAGALGDCCAEISGEHYSSEVILRRISRNKRAVLVKNLPFQVPEALQEIGIKSLVASVLCRKHNSALAQFDSAGGELFARMDEIDGRITAEVGGHEVFEVDGDRVERWLLKTLVAGLFSGNLRVGSVPDLKGVHPPREWLDILYRAARFPAGLGLYLAAAKPGEVLSTEPTVFKLGATGTHDGVVIGLQTWIFNFAFTLVLARMPDPAPPELTHATYRPRALVFVAGDGSNKRINFLWESGGMRDVVVQHLGTTRPATLGA